MAKTNVKPTKAKRAMAPASRVVTFNVHRALKGYHGKQKAPRAIREIKKLAFKEMGTEKVLINPSLNIGLWERGIRHVPHKLRLRITRKAGDGEDSSEQFVSEVEMVPVDSFNGLVTEKEA